MLFPTLISLLQAKCFGCHCLRLAPAEVRNCELKFDLLNRNLVEESLEVDLRLPATHVATDEGEETVESRTNSIKLAVNRYKALLRAHPVERHTTQTRGEYLRLCHEVIAKSKGRPKCTKCLVSAKTKKAQVRREGLCISSSFFVLVLFLCNSKKLIATTTLCFLLCNTQATLRSL